MIYFRCILHDYQIINLNLITIQQEFKENNLNCTLYRNKNQGRKPI